jgi:hypothetical protein
MWNVSGSYGLIRVGGVYQSITDEQRNQIVFHLKHNFQADAPLPCSLLLSLPEYRPRSKQRQIALQDSTC